MSEYVLSCCSPADLTKAHMDSRGIKYMYFHYFLDDKEYADDMGQSMSLPEFFKAMENGAMTRTSQPNIAEYLDYFTKFLEEGRDVIHLTLSSGISGAFNSARNAANIARERYPDRKIYVIDSLAASSGLGLLVDKLADLRDGGMDIDELAQWAVDNRLKVHHWFTSTDLTFFVRGGRISKAAGWFGTLLNICPVMNVDNLGRLIPRSKERTKKRALKALEERMEKFAEGGLDYSDKCYISNSACYEDAKMVADLIESRFPKLNGKVEINDIATTIGSHTGPGTVALFFWGSPRAD